MAAVATTLLGAGQGNDWTVIPGLRAGPITAATTRADLVRLFGKENVEEGGVGMGDAVIEGTVVLAARPEMSFDVEWVEGSSETRVYSLHFCVSGLAKSCKWHTQGGVTKGMTLKTLESLNGRAFTLLGFDWDYEGTVVSWRGGALEKLSRGCVGVRLMPVDAKHDPPELSGDGEFSSANPLMHEANPTVDVLSLGFECGAKK